MKIDFTEQEYRLLMDLLEMSDWLLHAHFTEEREETEKYSALMQKIYACAEEMGCGNLVEYDDKLNSYFATSEYEESGEYMSFIEEFEEDAFWDGLSHKLAFRDLLDQEGEEAIENMDMVERAAKLLDLQSWYEEEFNENGLSNIRIVKARSDKVN